MSDNQNSVSSLKNQARMIAMLIILIWALEVIDIFGNNWLDQLGIRPRSIDGLRGIIFAPWLHFGFEHLAANTIPLAVLAWFTMLRGGSRFIAVTAVIVVVAGIGTWLLGDANSLHAGSSILIFGYFGYLLFNGIFERSLHSISIALITILLYGSLIWGVLPFAVDTHVSWEGHLSGFIGGIMAAWMLNNRQDLPEDDDEEGDLDIRIGV